jgi:acyl-CoA hydrolase/GNAT superfamily N-acetyltransferase
MSISIPGDPMTADSIKKLYAKKTRPPDEALSLIRRGDRVFIGGGCGRPAFLAESLAAYARAHPSPVSPKHVYHLYSFGVVPGDGDPFDNNFRKNIFFIGRDQRDCVARHSADYVPIFLSQVPGFLKGRSVDLDAAIIMVSPPDAYGYMSLGVSVDITKAAIKNARLIVAQVNRRMPRVHGDAYVHLDDVDVVVPHDEELSEYTEKAPDEIADKIGSYVSPIIRDGDTIQVGYGSLPNAILGHLREKKHLGIHTELLTDGLVDLIRCGAVDNSAKGVDEGKSVVSFCMGTRPTYDYIHDNPGIEFRTSEYTNNPLVIARINAMTAVNTALAVDLTGQATAESIGHSFYSGIGGLADFMRGAILSPRGRTILTLPSTAEDGKVSRIVPLLPDGSGVTLGRGDVHYVVTEYGIAYLAGKNIRERAMELIAVAHPKFRPRLIEQARRLNLVYSDQAFITGKAGQYPGHLERWRTVGGGMTVLFRPVKISDEPLLKDFFYALSPESLYKRFFSRRQDMPHEILQRFAVIDYTREMIVLATVMQEEKEIVIGMGQYKITEKTRTAEAAMVVRDGYQGKGIGTVMADHLVFLARRQGLVAFTADVFEDNTPMLRIFEKSGFDVDRKTEYGVNKMRMNF